MLNPKPDFPQFTGERMKEWLSEMSMPALIFFWCDWRDECGYMLSLLKKLVKEYQKVDFYWVDADRQGNICRELSVPGVPTVLILKNGKEEARFICSSSQPGIRHHLDELVKAMERPRKTLLPVPVFMW